MRSLGKSVVAGTYFPESKVPANLNAFRLAMVQIGNVARRDPEYRKRNGKRYAADLSGATALTDGGQEKIFKNRPAPPYFEDLVVDELLNRACQFHAEYMAANKRLTHDGPSNHQGVDMSGYWMRAAHFGYKRANAGEGAGQGGVDDYPEGWMLSETHYRPWFNIGADVRTVGLGAAKASNGDWYFCKIGGVGLPTAEEKAAAKAKPKPFGAPPPGPPSGPPSVAPAPRSAAPGPPPFVPAPRSVGPGAPSFAPAPRSVAPAPPSGAPAPAGLVGKYTIAKPENGWHSGQIRLVGGKLEWLNDAGVAWGLTPKAGGDLDTDDRNPYRKETPTFVLKRQGGRVTGFQFGIHHFVKKP
jgi:hypothetical protein